MVIKPGIEQEMIRAKTGFRYEDFGTGEVFFVSPGQPGTVVKTVLHTVIVHFDGHPKPCWVDPHEIETLPLTRFDIIG